MVKKNETNDSCVNEGRSWVDDMVERTYEPRLKHHFRSLTRLDSTCAKAIAVDRLSLPFIGSSIVTVVASRRHPV